jgi:tripartite ATP-independent transporter DctP family solute receptor
MLDRRALLSGLTGVAISACRSQSARSQSAQLGRSIALVGDEGGEEGRRLRAAHQVAIHLHNEPKTSPLHKALTAWWNEVFERTAGELYVIVLPDDAGLPLGDAEAVDLTRAGQFAFVSVAAPILDALVPDIGLQSLPYVFTSVQDVLQFCDDPGFQAIVDADLAAADLVMVPGATFSNGFRIVASIASKPVRRLEDLRNMVIRIPPSIDLDLIFTAFGAKPIKTPIADMRDALMAHHIEAEENPPAIIDLFHLWDSVHWLNLTRHIWTGYNTLANRSFWSTLSQKTRELIVALLPAIRATQVREQEAANARIICAPRNLTIIETDLSNARHLMQPVYAAMRTRLSTRAQHMAEALIARPFQSLSYPTNCPSP